MDIGWGEMLLLAGLALVIFGPDKLPKVAADAGRMVRKLREMAQSAQTDLTDSVGADVKGIANDLRSVADLHPKRLFSSAVSDLNAATQPRPNGSPQPPASSTPEASGATADADSARDASPRARKPGFDPDAT